MACPLRLFCGIGMLGLFGHTDLGGVAFGRCLFSVYGGDAYSGCMTADGVELGLCGHWDEGKDDEYCDDDWFHGCKGTAVVGMVG